MGRNCKIGRFWHPRAHIRKVSRLLLVACRLLLDLAAVGGRATSVRVSLRIGGAPEASITVV